MSNKEILEKAIQKAIDGGWDRWHGKFIGIETNIVTGEHFVYFDLVDKKPKKKSERHYGIYGISLTSIFLDHDFAKALWGEDDYYRRLDDGQFVNTFLVAWQYHLQQMVIADDPIKYLGEHLKD